MAVDGFARWPGDDPREVLLGITDQTWLKCEMPMITLVDGPFRGMRHAAGQMAESVEAGTLVVLRGCHWFKA